MAIKQEARRCKVTSPLGEDTLFLTALDASERVSASPIAIERSGLDGQLLPFGDDSFDSALSTRRRTNPRSILAAR